MRIGMPLGYAGGFIEVVDRLRDFEEVGLDLVYLPEAYTFDAVSQLGFLAARTTTVRLATNILNVYSRTPALLAMTAAGLDYVSGGRFVLGLGASGPQVVEGFHGLPYTAPLGRTREVVEICRMVWAREPLRYAGRHFRLPLDREGGGSGLGRPLKLVNEPVRPEIPIVLAALGVKSVEQTAEIADGWAPMFYLPEAAPAAFAPALERGLAKRAPSRGPLEILAATTLLISEDPEEIGRGEQVVRRQLALYVGGMGAKGKNFYTDLVATYGFSEAATEIQALFLAGRRADAEAAVPHELIASLSLIGPVDHVRRRLAAFARHGVTDLNVTPVARSHRDRVRDVAAVVEAASEMTITRLN
ncbi:MAG: LLM class F420-dependent oxidoreductase [Nocardioides sp.]|uniref:LLM class F420-dependent oxidoreductase n=1 Tax=Nocardioides sp. TaxID=35761 RepID=UPI0039E6743F